MKFGVYLVFIYTKSQQTLHHYTKHASQKNVIIQPFIEQYKTIQNELTRTPKPCVEGSNPSAPAIANTSFYNDVFFYGQKDEKGACEASCQWQLAPRHRSARRRANPSAPANRIQK